MEMIRPTTRSITRRRDLASKARVRLSLYRDRVSADASAARVSDLLWAIAFAEQALAAESQGRYGDPYATPESVLRRSSREARIQRGQEVAR